MMQKIIVEIFPEQETIIYGHEDVNNFFISNKDFAEVLGISPSNLRAVKSGNESILHKGSHWQLLRMPTQGGMQMTTAWSKQGVIAVCNFQNTHKADEVKRWAEKYTSGQFIVGDKKKADVLTLVTEFYEIINDDDTMSNNTRKELTQLMKKIKSQL
ncbi:hypothetical protein [Flammeovirga aprica]|uniref:Bro-N domain-containing protein n=1 Tax=Flammeovirga aprica JL-4 TaxID=694437 RepID=A0A7X9RUM4_9BACT|nr:hypothetical protein [Flammeovirga aprica]NME69033.1 hypothetical protein [Flammeovirga aprica JL-4]